MKKFKFALAACLCCALAISSVAIVGCGNKKDYNKIALNEVTHSIFYAPFYAAINLGYMKDEGLEVTLKNGGGSNVSMSALISGTADMILAGPETVVYTSQEGISDKPKVFGQLTQTDGSFIVSKKGPDFELGDLVGETIIGGRAGGLPAMTLQYAIQSAGYEIGTGSSQVNLRTDVSFDAIASTFENSDANYCTLFEPNATNLVTAHPEYHIVGAVADLVNVTIPYTCFIAKESYLKNHSDVAEKFLRAVKRAHDYMKDCVNKGNLTDPAKALLPSFDGMSISELEVAVEAYYRIQAFSPDMLLTQKEFETLIKITQNAGMGGGNTNYESIVYNDIINKLS